MPDLLDRLSFEVLMLPPLRDRKEDITLLANHFAARMAFELEWAEMPEITEEAMELLERVRLANPDNLIARIALAAFYGRAGRREEARAAIREALQVAPDLTSERALQLIPGLESIAGPEEFARYPDTLRTAGLP